MLFIQLIDGYVDPDTLDITVAPIIALVYIGIIDGNMKDVAIILTGMTTTTLSSWSFDARVSNQHLVRSTSF